MKSLQILIIVFSLVVLFTAVDTFADSVAKTNGDVVSGKILGMEDGKISVQTQQGISVVEMEDVREFSVDKEKDSGVSEQMINQVLNSQDQILQRIDLLTQSIANLERQLLNVQSNQVANANRLTQRTREVNPLQRLFVVGQQINRVGGKTVISGQVMNQSETPVNNVQVDVYIYGSSGRLRNEGGQKKETVFVQPTSLAPGQAGTFSAAFPDTYKVENVNFDVRGLPPYGYSVNPPTGRASTGDF
ncbi:MAG: FxLYD domain-containing protein [Candidatus Omnitrophica bacterium]|nr:FxLYD domain-containing protein [Candidatus Omnitrophota bacterium]